jgi:capsid protein
MLDFFNKNKIKQLTEKLEVQSSSIENLTNALIWSDYKLFDGEKTEGELGRARIVYPDYETAGERAWELQLTSDIAKLVMKKWITWLIGKGLRFNATPPKEDRIPGFDRKEFINNVEYRFRNYLNSKYCDYSSMVDFHTHEKECDYNALVRGDVLCILRVENKRVTRQIIDGANVQTPMHYEGENQILDGVEYDSKGQHVAYWVYNDKLEHERIEAIHKPTGLKMAFLVYGSKFRLNETRGLPLLIEDYEKIKNLDRYIEATVKNAEVSSELILVNEHDATSTGENVMKNNVLKGLMSNSSDPGNELPNASCFKNSLTKLTKGVALNNTIGGKLKMLKPDAEGSMPNFLESNLKLIFGSAGIPYEVAISVYNSNYSASRAAIKDWEHNLQVMVNDISKQTYQPFYELWLYNEVLLGNIDAPQLIEAYRNKDYVTIAAINKATFTGVAVPSIDPLKEVNAVRKAMGDETSPLMTGEQAAEIISQKDYSEIQEQRKEEMEITFKQEENGNI